MGRDQVPDLGRLGKSCPFKGCSVSMSSSARAAKRLNPSWTDAGRLRAPLFGWVSSSRRLAASVKSQTSSAEADGGDVEEVSEGGLDPHPQGSVPLPRAPSPTLLALLRWKLGAAHHPVANLIAVEAAP